MIRTLLILVFLISLGCRLYSQSAPYYKDELYIKSDRIKLVGEIIYYSQDTVIFELRSGQQVKFETKQVYKIKQFKEDEIGSLPKHIREINPFDREKKMFFGLQAGINMLGLSDQFLSGLSSSIFVITKLSDHHYLRLDGGWEAIASFDGFRVLPVTIAYQYILYGHRFSPFASLGGGYGWVSLMDSDQFFTPEVFGGWRGTGGLGIYLHTRSRHLVELSTRFSFQSSRYELFSPWQTSERDIVFRRLFFKIGLIF